VCQIGEQGPIWRLLDAGKTSILFRTRPLYLAGAIAAFHSLDELQLKLHDNSLDSNLCRPFRSTPRGTPQIMRRRCRVRS